MQLARFRARFGAPWTSARHGQRERILSNTTSARLIGAGAAVVIAAGALAVGASATQAAPPKKNTDTAPVLVDATGAAVTGVVDIPNGTSVIRLVDGGLWRFSTVGKFEGSTQGGQVAFIDAECSVPVLVNGDFGDDPSAPLYQAPVAMSAVSRAPQQPQEITAAFVADGAAQSGTVYTTHWLDGTCIGPVLDHAGNIATVNYYPATEITIPADLPGPLSFK